MLWRHREIYESQEQQKLWAEELRHFMRMMPEAWAFRRGQARLVLPTWGNMAPDLACVGFFCTPIEGRRGRGENLCFRFGGTKYLNARNTGPIVRDLVFDFIFVKDVMQSLAVEEHPQITLSGLWFEPWFAGFFCERTFLGKIASYQSCKGFFNQNKHVCVNKDMHGSNAGPGG